jgi:hypothetical protein
MNSIIDDKKGIFNKLSVFTSLKEIELKPINGFNSIQSINNEKDPLPFLLDLSTSLVGSDGLQNKLGLLFTQFIDTYNTKSKELFKSNFIDYNQNLSLPTSFTSSGIDIPVTFLDDSNNLKTPKVDPIGELIYDDSKDNLLTKLRNSITQPNTDINFGNINIVYDQNTDTINIKPIGSLTIGSFLNGYIDSFSGINKKEFVSEIMDKIYGVKSKDQDKTLTELNNENTVDELLYKLINEEDVELSDDDLARLNQLSEEMFKGNNEINFGCGVINNVLTTENLRTFADSINQSVDPNEVGNLFTDVFTNSLDENSDESNTSNLKDSFFKKLFNLFKTKILKDLLFSPEKKLVFMFLTSFDNQSINNMLDPKDFINNNKNICNCLVKDISSDLIEFVFNLVKTEILEVTKPALKKIITEKIKNYQLLLNSLISI